MHGSAMPVMGSAATPGQANREEATAATIAGIATSFLSALREGSKGEDLQTMGPAE